MKTNMASDQSMRTTLWIAMSAVSLNGCALVSMNSWRAGGTSGRRARQVRRRACTPAKALAAAHLEQEEGGKVDRPCADDDLPVGEGRDGVVPPEGVGAEDGDLVPVPAGDVERQAERVPQRVVRRRIEHGGPRALQLRQQGVHGGGGGGHADLALAASGVDARAKALNDS